tara:strand:- start:845 stop:1300 length:456 start_codon:yes stop_codon:yes gene_type:complete
MLTEMDVKMLEKMLMTITMVSQTKSMIVLWNLEPVHSVQLLAVQIMMEMDTATAPMSSLQIALNGLILTVTVMETTLPVFLVTNAQTNQGPPAKTGRAAMTLMATVGQIQTRLGLLMMEQMHSLHNLPNMLMEMGTVLETLLMGSKVTLAR